MVRGANRRRRGLTRVPSVEALDPVTLIRALAKYELDRLDFPEAYLAANAEATGVREILSSDRALDRVAGVARRES
jgi:predicted nucleic acid-binding protein